MSLRFPATENPVLLSQRCLIILLAVFSSFAATAGTFSLQTAIDRTAEVHPQLKIFEWRQGVLEAESAIASLKPTLNVNAEIENVLGSGPYSGVTQGEYSLTLSGVLERDMKREARRAVAMRRLDGLAVERAAAELDLLSEVNRRYLDFVATVTERPLIERARDRQQDLAMRLRQWHIAGGVTESVVLAAEAEAARLEGEYQQSYRDERFSWHRLSMLWGDLDMTGPIPVPVTLPTALPKISLLPEMLIKVRSTPDIEFFASAHRVNDAEIRLIEAERQRDVEWVFGIRRFAGDSENAIVAGVSVPLGQSTSIDLRISAEKSRQRALGVERERRLLELEAILIRLYSELERQTHRVSLIELELVPRLVRSVEQGMNALQAGAITYMELAQIQRELLSAERERLASTISVYRHLVEIQRLTAESWESTPPVGGESQ